MENADVTDTYELYALRYATHPKRRASENFIFMEEEEDRLMPLDFYFWAIRSAERTIVVDTGFGRERAAARGRTFLHEPEELLGAIGIDARAVTDVVLTHMHYDHIGNVGRFPRASFHVQDAEIAYSTGRAMAHRATRQPFEVDDVVETIRCVYGGRMRFHAGPAQLAPGISLHLVGGHTPGLQVVRVRTARGWVVLASDAAHYWSNIRKRSPFPIVVDVPGMLDAHRAIEELADGPEHVIPGHDPAVVERFRTLPDHPDIALLHEEPLPFGREAVASALASGAK